MPQATYASAGVDRDLRAQAKRFNFNAPVALKTPFNDLFELSGSEYYLVTCDGVGTKVLIAELAGKFDTLGIDAVAMVVNDAVRCGAKPEALLDILDVKKSEPKLVEELVAGIEAGASQAGCFIAGGETADVPELLGNGFVLNASCFARVEKKKAIVGDKLKKGDVWIGLRSSGLHSNGVSLARKLLFTEWGGAFDAREKPDGIDNELVLEALTPTKIYVKDVLRVVNSFNVKAAVHVTGDAYLKFGSLFKFSKGVGFEFDNFKPQPIFGLMREAAVKKGMELTLDEMFKTFNMGWGFALAVEEGEADDVLQALPDSEVIGKVNDSAGSIVVLHDGQKIKLSGG